MKILQIVKLYSPWIGGVEKIAQDISEGINGVNNVTVEVLCCQPKGGALTERVNRVKVMRTSSIGILRGLPLSFSFIGKLRKIASEYEVLDVHLPFPLADIAIFFANPKSKIVVHYHSDIVRQRFLKWIFLPLVRNTLKQADKIIVSNPNLVKNSDLLGKFAEKCRVVPFGVDLQEIERSQDYRTIKAIKAKYGKFVLYVGRLSYYKGVEYLVRAMEKLNCNLVVIGDGPLRSRLSDLVDSKHLDNRIFFLGGVERKKIINYMSAATIFVLPSVYKSEAFGIVLIEAMACGTPVISTELGTGTSWVNQDRKTGLVVKPRSAQELCAAINSIMESDKIRNSYSEEAKNRVRKTFLYDQFLLKTLSIYQEEGQLD